MAEETLRRGRRASLLPSYPPTYGVEVHAGYFPWPGGPRGVLSGTPGVRVVPFFADSGTPCRTRLLRPGSAVLALAGQRGVLARSSGTSDLAIVSCGTLFLSFYAERSDG